MNIGGLPASDATMRSVRPIAAVLAALTFAGVEAASTLPAAASHYRFARIEMVTPAERAALAAVDVRDTRALLHYTARLSHRVWLARATRIDLDRLAELAAQCDLLRVDGIGPSMVEALHRAGVMDTGSLSREVPGPLLGRLRAATKGTSLRYRLPEESTLSWWIHAARRLRPLLDFTPAPRAFESRSRARPERAAARRLPA